jgi:hypothetical protein
LSGGLNGRLTENEAKNVTIPVLQAREADAWLVVSEMAKDAARG